MSAQLATQRRVLLGQALVPIPSAPLTDFSQRSAEFELSKAIVTLRRGKVRAQPLTNIACNVRQSSRRPRVRRHQRSTRTAAQCARSATPDLPVTDHILTPSTDARRPRCASPPDPRPTSFLHCALFFPAPNRVTTVTSTAKCPPLHRQRTGRRPHQYSPYNADRPVVSPILRATTI